MWVGAKTLSDMYLPQVCICTCYFSVWYLCSLFLCTKLAPKLNLVLMWLSCPLVLQVGAITVNTKCLSVPIIFVHQICQVCIWAHYFSAQNIRVCPMWMCTKCEWAPSHYIPAPSVHLHLLFFSVYFFPLFLCVKCQSVPNGVGTKSRYTCTKYASVPVIFQSVSVPIIFLHEMSMWMGTKCQSTPNVNAHDMSECAQCEYAPSVSGCQVTIYLHQASICTGYFSVCICTHYFSAWNVGVCQMWMCTRHE